MDGHMNLWLDVGRRSLGIVATYPVSERGIF